MKNKLEGEFKASERFAGDLPVTEVNQGDKTRRDSMAPKIVVCPPVEEMPEPVAPARGSRLLKALSRRLRRNADDDSLKSSSSNESMSCDTGRSEDPSSCSTSDSGSDESERRKRHRSTVSLRRVFQNLNISRSQSSSPTDRHRQPKKQPQPKRILRPPVSYTYVRGLSGLPTQRVPRHTVYCNSVGLNR